MSIRDLIVQVVRGQDLSQEQAASAMEEIMTGVASAAQIAAFLTALHLKGETDAEIAGMAEVMRAKATPVHFDGALLDLVRLLTHRLLHLQRAWRIGRVGYLKKRGNKLA